MFSDRNYESPLEAAFEWDFAKHVEQGVSIIPQVECPTMLGTFRLDFQISGKFKVGVELDGEEFHDEWRDECRDAIILGEQQCDIIYRFKGKDIWNNTADMLYFMSNCDPWMFSDAGRKNLKTLSCRQQEERDPHSETHIVTVSYFDDSEEEHFRPAIVSRRSRFTKRKQYWENLFEFALQKRPTTLDHMIQLKEMENQEKIRGSR